jgi:membrane protein
MKALARSLAEHPRVAGVVELARRCIARTIEVEFVDRAIALASLTFTALIPLGVVVSAVVPGIDQDGLAKSIDDRFHLDADTAKIVDSVFAPPSDVKQTVSIIGVALLIGSALSFTRGMQRVYERAWQLPALGVRATPAGLVWILGLVVFISIFGGIRSAVIDSSRPIVSVITALVFAAAVWLGSPWILLSRRVAWRLLMPTALLTAVAMSALSVAAVIYMPRSIADSAERYGPIGVAISLVSFFVAAGFVIVVCAAVGAVLGEHVADRERKVAP